MPDVLAGSVGAAAPATPGSTGAKPTDQAYADAGAVVNPPDQSPAADAQPTGDAPGQASDAKPDSGPSIDEWKKSLKPDDQKQVDRIITQLRQKDSEDRTALETKLQRLGWAEELSRLVSSPEAGDRHRAAALIRATLSAIESTTPKPEADPLAHVDEAAAEIEAYSPAAAALLKAMAAETAGLREKVSRVAGTAETLEAQRADEYLDQQVKTVEAFTKQHDLPWDEAKVLATAEKLNLGDMKAAYFATFGEQILEAGKQSALKSLQVKKQAALPGGGPTTGTAVRPKFKDMMEAFQHAKQEAGVSGSILE